MGRTTYIGTPGAASTWTAPRIATTAAAWGALLLCGVSQVRGQASPWLAADHWTREASVRLHALGSTPRGFDPSARVHTVSAMRAALAGCAGNESDAVRLPRGCAAVFGVERSGSAPVWAEAGVVYTQRQGALLGGGFTQDREWTGPEPIARTRRAAVRVRVGAVPFRRMMLSAGVEAGVHGVRVEQANAEVRLGPIGVWGGRRVVGYAPGAGGGLVLNGVIPVDGVGVRIADAVELAWLGATTAEVFIGVADSSGFVAQPWLLGMRLHVQPHARFDAGATRAAVSGSTVGARISVRQVVEVLVGANPGGDYADDQVASLDARWRPPLGRVPLELFGEWALHDVDVDVLVDVPAFTVGARMPAIPGAEALGIALEHTRIAGSCCDNPPWYHHFELANGWTDSGVLRGHPLGGHGREWRLSMDGALLDWRLLVRAEALVRTRAGENLFAPVRAGRAHGGALIMHGMLSAHTGVDLRITHEAGTEWSETGAVVALRWHR